MLILSCDCQRWGVSLSLNLIALVSILSQSDRLIGQAGPMGGQTIVPGIWQAGSTGTQSASFQGPTPITGTTPSTVLDPSQTAGNLPTGFVADTATATIADALDTPLTSGDSPTGTPDTPANGTTGSPTSPSSPTTNSSTGPDLTKVDPAEVANDICATASFFVGIVDCQAPSAPKATPSAPTKPTTPATPPPAAKPGTPTPGVPPK